MQASQNFGTKYSREIKQQRCRAAVKVSAMKEAETVKDMVETVRDRNSGKNSERHLCRGSNRKR